MTNIILNGSSAVQLQQASAAGFSLQNNGPGNVYLDNDASVSPSTGYVVQPGVSLPLNSGAVLFACTDNSNTANVQLLQGATATQATIVEANVPGSINANITNSLIPVSGSVQATITNASLPVSGSVNANITNASIPVSGTVNASITNASIPVSGTVSANISGPVTIPGGVTVNNSTLNVGGSVSTKQQTATLLPLTNSATFTTSTMLWDSGLGALTSYQTLAIQIGTLINNQSMARAQVSLHWYGGSSYNQYRVVWMMAGGNVLNLTVPVEASGLQIYVAPDSGTTMQVQTVVYGLSNVVPPSYQITSSPGTAMFQSCTGTYTPGNGIAPDAYVATVAAGATGFVYLSSIGGTLEFFALATANISSARLIAHNLNNTSYAKYIFAQPLTGNLTGFTSYLSGTPLVLEIDNTGSTSSTVYFNMQSQGTLL